MKNPSPFHRLACCAFACVAATLTVSIASAKTLVSGTIEANQTWDAAGSPYEVSNATVNSNVTITVTPGAVVQFLDYATLHVHGRMVATGTASQKVTFTSLSGATQGNPWGAIRLTNASGAGNGLPGSSFTHCIFEGGGYWYLTMLEVWGGAGSSIDQCVFRHSSADGIRFYENSGGAIGNTRFESNAGYALWLRGSSPAVNNCVFAGNGNVGRVESGAGKGSFPDFNNTTFSNSGYVHIATNIDSGGTLTAAPYYLDAHRFAVAGATITIEAGATFAIADYSSWTIHGNLIADGTEAKPIVFSRAGDNEWGAVRMTNNEGAGDGVGNRLSHCTFDGGGYWYQTLLEMWGGDPLTLDHCTFRNSTQDGFRVWDLPGGTISDTGFENNAGYGFRLYGSSPTVNHCAFSGNGNAGRLESSSGKGSFPDFNNTTFTNSGYVHIASNIESGGTLTAAPYYIGGHPHALAGATITIEGGSTFAIADYSSWTIRGNLIADGTEARPIVFSRAGDNEWGGVRLTNNDGNGDGAANRLSYCTFDGGGYWYQTLLEAWGGAPLTLDHCTFRNSTQDGFRVWDLPSGTISDTDFENNAGYGFRLHGSSPTMPGCAFSGNGNAGRLESSSGKGSFPAITGSTFAGDDRIHIASNIDSGGTLAAAPYYLDGHHVAAAGATITIEGGSTFAIANYSSWTIRGNLIADGTEARPIVFSRAGDNEWGAVRLTNNDGAGGGAANRLSHCTFDGGGYWYQTLLEAWGGAPLTLDHCTFRNSTQDGVRASNQPSGAITGCTFEDCTEYGLRLSSASPAISGSTFQRFGREAILLLSTPAGGASLPAFSGNTFGVDDYVAIGSNIDSSGQLSNPGGAYLIGSTMNIVAGADISVAPGTTIKFGDYASLRVSGSLDAFGKSAAPITLTSDDEVKAPSQWGGLIFLGDRTRPSTLQNCIVEGGGYWYGTLVEVAGATAVTIDQCTLRTCSGDGMKIWGGTDATVSLTSVSDCSGQGIFIESGAPRIDACDIHDNAGSGIYANTARAVVTNSLLRNNGSSGLRALGGSVPGVTNSFISGNGDFGVQNQTGFDLPAQNNWWGDPSGPYHAVTNPEGTGDKVSDRVIYQPYRVFASGIPQELQATLTNGVAVQGTFPQGVHGFYYAVDVPAGQNLVLSVDDANDQGVTQVYLSRNSFPTPGDYQLRQETNGPDQRLFVPGAGPGRWYALVFQFTAENASNFTIRADMADISLFEVAPARHSNTVPITMMLSGAGFTAGAQVSLVSGARSYPAATSEIDSFSRMTATFAAGSVPAGTYDVRVSVPGKSPATLPGAFVAVDGGRGKLVADIIVPSAVGYHQLATLFVEYTNEGDAAMPAPLLIVSGEQNGENRALLTLDRWRLTQGFWTSAVPEGFSNTVQVLGSGATPGVLQPGESGRIPIYYAGWQQPWDFTYPPISFGLSILEATDTRPVDWNALRNLIDVDGMQPAALNVIWENYKAAIGPTIGDFVSMLGANAAYLARLGYTIADVDALNQFEFLQAEGIAPLPDLSEAVDYSLQATGIPLEFSRFFPANLSRRFRPGALGRGWVHSWDISSSSLADGTVVVRFRGESRVFQPDVRGGYFSSPHDRGKLAAGGAGTDHVLTEPDGTSYSFSGGRLTTVRDRNGNSITATYTGANLTRLVHSSGPSLTLAYDGQGRITSITDHRSRRTSFSYAGGGELLASATNPSGRVTTYSQNGSSGAAAYALTAVQSGAVRQAGFTYDQKGRLASVALAGGTDKTDFSYDSAGGVTMKDGLNQTSRTFYDHRGIATRFTDAHGASVTQRYGPQLNLVSDEDGSGAERSYAYDSTGRLARITGKLGGVQKFSYGADNRITSVTDPEGRTTRVSYDAKGNVAGVTENDGSARNFERDSLGNVTAFVNARGERVTLGYDGTGRLVTKSYPNGDVMNYTYDSRGRLATTTDPSGTTAFQYTADDQLAKVTYPGGASVAYTYDGDGRRASTTDHNGSVQRYEYDGGGRLARVSDGTNRTLVAYQFDAAGNIARKVNPDGTSATYEYHQSGQVSRETRFDASGAQTGAGTISYDDNAMPVTITTGGETRNYSWDADGKLLTQTTTPANGGATQTDRYEYDASGRLTRVTNNGVASNYVTNSRGDYVSAGDTAYAHDADGNVTSASSPSGTTTYQYDSENRMVAASSPAGTWDRTIGATGLTTATRENGATYRMVNDPASPVTFMSALDSAGQYVARAVQGLDFTSYTNPFANSPVVAPTPLSLLQYRSFPLSPSGAPIIPSINTIAELGARAFTNPAVQSVADAFANVVTWTPLGIGNGAAGVVHDVVNLVTGREIVTILPWSQKALQVGRIFQGFAVVSGVVETVQGAMTNDDTKIYHGSGSVALTAVGYWLGTSSAAYWAPALAAASGPIGIALGVAAIAIDAGYLDSTFERFWIWWDDLDVDPQTHRSKASQSMDPNEKLGPAGFGDANFVAPGALLPYRVDFENDKDALAPAQVVMISDPLSDRLDWSTFELTEVGFGDHLIPVSGSTQSLEWVEPMVYDGRELEVSISIALNPVTGVILAIFSTIDVETGLPPEVQYGFLPPEDGTGRGQGYFAYTIRARNLLPTGTEIRNVATITFDFGEVIDTNQVDPHDPSKGTDPEKEALVTIDATRPSSAVQALPANSASSFTVRWTGSDGSGSGVGRYTVFVRDGAGAFAPWLENTTQESATFSGTNGHTYQFYSIARDNVGNEEAAKTAGEATTTVSGGADPYQGWLAQFFTAAEIQAGVLTARTADPDGDGITNGEEFAFVTDPRSVDAPAMRVERVGGSLVIDYWRRTSGATYQVVGSANLAAWSPVQNATHAVLQTAGERQLARATVPISAARSNYYRIQAQF